MTEVEALELAQLALSDQLSRMDPDDKLLGRNERVNEIHAALRVIERLIEERT